MYGKSYLIIGSDPSQIRFKLDKILKDCGITSLKSPDVADIGDNEKSIGINLIRELQTFLSKKPLVSKKKLALIRNAQNLTLEAQNALLKLLEEPTSSSQIVLLAAREENLLPTVTSRCIKITIKNTFSPDKEIYELAFKFIKSGVGDRLALVEENRGTFTNREETIKFLDTLLFCLRSNLGKDMLNFANLTMKVQKDVSSTNVNPRLAIEYLALN